ncbi:MAG: CapA family protein [Fimbriimonadaceae bacterium]|nr:CapA family protein [Fimbriimonadaceae bacterium]
MARRSLTARRAAAPGLGSGGAWRWGLGALLLLAPPGPAVVVAAVGDVQPARGMTARLQRHGWPWAWDRVRPWLRQADWRCANFEGVASDRGSARGQPYSFRTPPARAVGVLRAGGFNLVSLANNHAGDYGPLALADSLAAFGTAGLQALGAGADRAAAVTPTVLTRPGLRVAWLAYTDWPGSARADESPVLATVDDATFDQEIAAAAAAAEVLVLSVHWGTEYRRSPDPRQRALAARAVAAGADLILGHGPHVAQPVELLAGRPVVYSLGNALFDRDDERYSSGLLVRVRLAPDHAELLQTVRLRLREGRPEPVG